MKKRTLKIVDAGEILTLNYSDAFAAHKGESWFGVAVAFCMLQMASDVLSQSTLWNRNDLYIVNYHPGDGVRDVIEYVTQCISRKQYELNCDDSQKGCGRNMQFKWKISTPESSVSLVLRDDFVPEEFYLLLDRLGTQDKRPEDANRFSELKRDLAEQLWQEPPERLFNVEVYESSHNMNEYEHA